MDMVAESVRRFGICMNMVEGSGHVGARFEGGRKHSSQEVCPRTQRKEPFCLHGIVQWGWNACTTYVRC